MSTETQYTDIRAALSQQLKTMSGVPVIAWENNSFTPTSGVPYLVPNVLWAESFQAELGTDGANRESGIYQITANYPPNQGVGLVNSMVGKLRDRFRRGTTLTYNGLVVRIRKVSLGPQTISSIGISQSISISFHSTVPN